MKSRRRAVVLVFVLLLAVVGGGTAATQWGDAPWGRAPTADALDTSAAADPDAREPRVRRERRRQLVDCRAVGRRSAHEDTKVHGDTKAASTAHRASTRLPVDLAPPLRPRIDLCVELSVSDPEFTQRSQREEENAGKIRTGGWGTSESTQRGTARSDAAFVSPWTLVSS